MPHVPVALQYFITAVSAQLVSFGSQIVHVAPHAFPPHGL
jgi:hypothetical protein